MIRREGFCRQAGAGWRQPHVVRSCALRTQNEARAGPTMGAGPGAGILGVEGGTEPLRLLNTGKIQVSGCVEGPENTENG